MSDRIYLANIKGDTGTGIEIKGYYNTLADLKVEEFEANRKDTMAEIAKLEEAIDAEYSVKSD